MLETLSKVSKDQFGSNFRKLLTFLTLQTFYYLSIKNVKNIL